MFYSNDSVSWIPLLRNNWEVFLNELDAFILHNDTNLQSSYSNYTHNDGWLTVPLIFFTIQNKPILTHFPRTHRILKEIPDLIGAEFSILKPDTIIKAHEGYSKQVMRTHLSLKVPNGNLGFKSQNETIVWKEGGVFSFNDGEVHEAWNKSDKERWVLMIDTPIPDSPYSAKDISTYKMKDLNDPVLLQIADKSEWIKWYNQGYFDFEDIR